MRLLARRAAEAATRRGGDAARPERRIELSGGGKAADRFLRRLKLIQHAPSLGGVDSLVSEPRYTSHAALSSEERAKIGIPDGFLRLSIGIEDAEDVIADLEQALK